MAKLKAAIALGKWKASIGTVWVCLMVICLIASMSGYCVSLSAQEGFRFAMCGKPLLSHEFVMKPSFTGSGY